MRSKNMMTRNRCILTTVKKYFHKSLVVVLLRLALSISGDKIQTSETVVVNNTNVNKVYGI